jgi:hypothetical protein
MHTLLTEQDGDYVMLLPLPEQDFDATVLSSPVLEPVLDTTNAAVENMYLTAAALPPMPKHDLAS